MTNNCDVTLNDLLCKLADMLEDANVPHSASYSIKEFSSSLCSYTSVGAIERNSAYLCGKISMLFNLGIISDMQYVALQNCINDIEDFAYKLIQNP